LIKEDLVDVLGRMGNAAKDIRDRALLLLGFAAALRRSEIVAVVFTDIEFVRQGMVVTIRRSKTDQEAQGRRIGVPLGRGRWCPVEAMNQWLGCSQIKDGPIFRRVDRHSRILAEPMSAAAISMVLKERVLMIGLDPAQYSGHSLRAGLATSAAAAGVSSWKIREQTGHGSDAMLRRYIRAGELFVDNAAGALL
jgi:integrase